MQSEVYIDKPELIERYPDLIRINYGTEVTPATNLSVDGSSEPVTKYIFQMKEYAPQDMPKDADTLADDLMRDRYPLEEQVRVLSSEDSAQILAMQVFKQTCKDAARQIFNIPETLKSAKEKKYTEIAVYDSSANVNGFTIQGRRLWLDRNTRAALMRRFEAEKASGVKETTLWYGDGKFDMPVDTAIQMLNAIEIYACKCFDVTAAHKAKVSGLTTIDEVIGYDYKTGYPEQLNFKI